MYSSVLLSPLKTTTLARPSSSPVSTARWLIIVASQRQPFSTHPSSPHLSGHLTSSPDWKTKGLNGVELRHLVGFLAVCQTVNTHGLYVSVMWLSSDVGFVQNFKSQSAAWCVCLTHLSEPVTKSLSSAGCYDQNSSLWGYCLYWIKGMGVDLCDCGLSVQPKQHTMWSI